jgi:hypothetical protein
MLMGRNPYSPLLLAILKINEGTKEQYPLGRIRDIWISNDGKTIKILHRNYGDEGAVYNHAMAQHPQFVRQEACGRDATYQYWVFDVPDDFHQDPDGKKLLESLITETDRMEPMDRYWKAIEDMKSGKKNPQTDHMEKVGRKIMEGLTGVINGKTPDTTMTDGDGSVDIIGG